MLVKYFDDDELVYASRKRFKSFNFTPFAQEEQRSVLLGDGARTSIKTSVNNICNYITIDDTRWFVTDYTYLNGKQVQLNLQRDVIGEFGINNCFGKVERGYTDGILKYRKELSLNQILKKRIPLIPNTNQYNNYFVDNHNDELWGILYITKPTELDPITGEQYPDQVNINIPAFAPSISDKIFIENGTKYITSKRDLCNIYFTFYFFKTGFGSPFYNKYRAEIKFNPYNYTATKNLVNLGRVSSISNVHENTNFHLSIGGNPSEQQELTMANQVADMISSAAIGNLLNGFSLPTDTGGLIQTPPSGYDGIVIKNDEKYLRYSVKNNVRFNTYYGSAAPNTLIYSIRDYLKSKTLTGGYVINDVTIPINISSYPISTASYIEEEGSVFSYTELSPSESGNIVIDVTKQLIDEPYFILAFPLYNVTIKNNLESATETYSIDRGEAFMVFNTVIQYLSGENGYLVDAQIYPYCPELIDVNTQINGYPFFNINSTSYTRSVEVNLYPYSDVKKEYIKREYSIVSPEQSGKFTFQFYDYVNNIDDNNGQNMTPLNIYIKTALKPFGIISSAVIQPSKNPVTGEYNSIIGMTYESDLRGSQPSGNGFECSLANNAFQTYKRNNSNYQQIFKLQQDELHKQNYVEAANELASVAINTTTATAMGAIAGGQLGELGIGKLFGSKAAGAAAGAGIAAGTVGLAMSGQYLANEELRRYEEQLLQDRFDLQIGTIKNLPNSINRISSFNEIILKDFWYIIEVYECSTEESNLVDTFIANYGYSIGAYGYLNEFYKNGWFLRANVIASNFAINHSVIANNELRGGIYLYE